VNAAAAAMTALSKAYWAMDASLAEINPFILTTDGKVYALDAKITFDDKRPVSPQRTGGTARPERGRSAGSGASKHGLNYIKLDGTVGCMVNGAGLAMATMDIIKFAAAVRRTFGTSRRGQRGAGEECVPHPAFPITA